MSDPRHLQDRLAQSFATDSAPAGAGADTSLAGPQGEPEKKSDWPDDVHSPRLRKKRHGRYLLVGAGLILAALAVAVALDSGATLLAICLCAFGVANLLFAFADWFEHQTTRAEAMSPEPFDGSYSTQGEVLASIHDALGDMIVCRSLDGTILSANGTFCAVTGCSDPRGKRCEALGLVFLPGLIRNSYDVEIRQGASLRVYLWHDVIAFDPNLGRNVMQSIARDVTDERQDAVLREAARRHAEEDSLLKSRLIATVSHEIRTPLSGLLGMGHLLAGTALTAEQRNYLDGIRESGTALVQLVEDLLDFSTLAAGRFQLRPREEPIRPLIEAMVELLASRAHAKGIEIGSVVAPDIGETLRLDPARFRQVLYNVIGNAIKFTDNGGVLISTSLNAGMLEVEVSDTGPGMNAGELQRIFGEFEQGDLSKAREGGVGLGLAISARILAEAGGALSVISQPGQGSTFTIRLPVEPEGSGMRSGHELAAACLILLAPEGPAATALARTLEALGAEVLASYHIGSIPDRIDQAGLVTGIVVDHRLHDEFGSLLARQPGLRDIQRIYLVNPESRPASISETFYDSWLIRPLREQSLIDVLTGKFKGLEPRQDGGDSFPVLAAEVGEEPPRASLSNLDSRLTIAFGEDDPVNAMIVRAILERVGHHVLHAENFARLEEVLEHHAADLVITDFSMPDGTSEGFIATLRNEEEMCGEPALPVIVLTADRSDETRRRLLLSGADLVLTKPAAPELLVSAVLRLCEKRAEAA